MSLSPLMFLKIVKETCYAVADSNNTKCLDIATCSFPIPNGHFFLSSAVQRLRVLLSSLIIALLFTVVILVVTLCPFLICLMSPMLHRLSNLATRLIKSA